MYDLTINSIEKYFRCKNHSHKGRKKTLLFETTENPPDAKKNKKK